MSLPILPARAYYPANTSSYVCVAPGRISAKGSTLGHRLFLAVTWILKGLLRVGLPMGPMVLLTVFIEAARSHPVFEIGPTRAEELTRKEPQ